MPKLTPSPHLVTSFLHPALSLRCTSSSPLICGMVGTRSGKRASSGTSSESKVPSPSSEKRARTSASAATVKQKPRDADAQRYWLLKSEPESRFEKNSKGEKVDMKFGIDDLMLCKDQTEPWDGVRNHEAKNAMMEMKAGELGFFYHSNCKKVRPHIAGVVKIVREAYPDHTAWDCSDPHFDARSTEDAPHWFMVDVQFVSKFKRPVSLDEIRAKDSLADMRLVRRSRISVVEVSEEEWKIVTTMGNEVVEKK